MSPTPLSHEVHGTGDAVVLLHSFPLDRRMWSGQRALFAGTGHRGIVVDLPGFGASPVPEAGPPSLEAMARAVVDTLDAAGAERAVWVGLSLGGYVALAAAEIAPERVAGLVLADTRAGADDPPTRAGRMLNLALVRDRGAAALTEKLWPRLVAPDAAEAVRARVRELGAAQSREGVAFALAAMRDRPDRRALAASLDLPTLVVVGARDEITPPAEMRDLASSMRRADFVEIAGAGHLSALENPADFNAAVLAFLRRARGAAG